jgi:hypothetical protein
MQHLFAVLCGVLRQVVAAPAAPATPPPAPAGEAAAEEPAEAGEASRANSVVTVRSDRTIPPSVLGAKTASEPEVSRLGGAARAGRGAARRGAGQPGLISGSIVFACCSFCFCWYPFQLLLPKWHSSDGEVGGRAGQARRRPRRVCLFKVDGSVFAELKYRFLRWGS